MKTTQNFGLIYFLLVIGQMMICNFSHLGPYIYLSILPAMVMCIPTTVGTVSCMFIAFATGISVDWLADGMMGLNTASLLPVALLRRSIIRSFLGEDIITRKDSFSIHKNGIVKIIFLSGVSYIVFLALYVFLDGAGERSFGFCIGRFFASLPCNLIISILAIHVLTPDERK